MEMSRQRLRPALSEGSHVTCPRCNGTGHIRDTESSALQVLRIIQEEAMKENTAAIHTQVPVEVAAFLLNEKRAEVIKIETRFKVNVLMVPNKHLETPHYKLERLRHDDPRLDDQKASYVMAEEAARELETDTTVSKKDADVKVRPEAAVKGITPTQPAPISQPRPARTETVKAESSGGFFGFIKNLFGSSPAVEEKPAPSNNRGRNQGRNGNGGDRNRGRNRRGRGRGQRGERTEATGDAPAVVATSTPSFSGPPAGMAGASATMPMQNIANSFGNAKPAAEKQERAPRAPRAPRPAQSAAPAPVVAAAAIEVIVKPMPELPKVAFQALEETPLHSVVQSAGMIWVATDSSKHAEVQGQIQAEPVKENLGRAPKPAASLPDGPMVLVETGGQEKTV